MKVSTNVFDGIKVADFSWNAVGPVSIRYLALHGATVVHIETSLAPDASRLVPPYKDDVTGINRAPFWAEFNSNKLGMALNLNHPKGLEIAKKLIAWADIVAESYSPGQMTRWGLSYQDIKKIKPDIIMYSASMQGQSGPHARHPGFGNLLVALCGVTHILGYPGEQPLQPYGAYTDWVCPRFGIAAIVAALDYRRRTGIGQYLDLSQYETSLYFIAPALLDYEINKRIINRTGNRCSYASPHNVFKCKGEQSWCAISILNDEQWDALCRQMGNPSWTKDQKFSTLIGRKKNEDELEGLIENWTKKYNHYELMHKLQKEGIQAAAVLNAIELIDDEQIKYRQHFKTIEHPEIGTIPTDGIAYKLSETPAELRTTGPCLGQHTDYVCTSILGMSDEEFAGLLAEGVFE